MEKTGRQPRAFHPLLLAAYPALFLFARNTDEATLADLGRALAVLISAACLVWLVARLAVRDRLKAALVVSLTVIAAFSFGYFLESVHGATIGGLLIGRVLVVGPLWFLLFAVLLFLVVRTGRSLVSATAFANSAALVLVGVSLAQAVVSQFGGSRGDAKLWGEYLEKQLEAAPLLAPQPGSRAPNIYYIILDEYARADVLKGDLGFDNSEFVSALERRGFFVAERSLSNYNSTPACLASTFNLDYLQALKQKSRIESLNMPVLLEMVRESLVIRMLKNAGYSMVMLPSGHRFTESSPYADRVCRRPGLHLNEFERVLLGKSVFSPFLALPIIHRRDVLFNLDNLGKPRDIDGPVFVFAHIMAPHPPYVFDREGNMPQQSFFGREIEYNERAMHRYTDQVVYTNKRVLEALDRILEAEDEPPVILLQGDHGYRYLPRDHSGRLRVSNSILSAYYLPPSGGESPDSVISPVNSFRLVFDRYLGGRYGRLPDESYIADYGKGLRTLRLTRLEE